ncbi:uncharacterized protein LOC133196509 [Saccostrea echinata]|uniref:uncharacterized protein LOC133196509 n=1 Tax=Saccostrea echinata TaxID=191078 RepID=UPI002A7F96CF|nr:uncharacterized protein LOC133196509 [Saccostrea echinata]
MDLTSESSPVTKSTVGDVLMNPGTPRDPHYDILPILLVCLGLLFVSGITASLYCRYRKVKSELNRQFPGNAEHSAYGESHSSESLGNRTQRMQMDNYFILEKEEGLIGSFSRKCTQQIHAPKKPHNYFTVEYNYTLNTFETVEETPKTESWNGQFTNNRQSQDSVYNILHINDSSSNDATNTYSHTSELDGVYSHLSR